MYPCDVCKREVCATDDCTRNVYRIEQTAEAREKLLATTIAASFRKGVGARARGKTRARFETLTFAEVAAPEKWNAAVAEIPADSHIARNQEEIRKALVYTLREALEKLGEKRVRVCVECAERTEEDRRQLGAVWARILPETYAKFPLPERRAQQWA